ncbi:MAG: ABC transporter permease [Turicibacter sp.]|nr:ABC transporter permease [Turicibacter sp.]
MYNILNEFLPNVMPITQEFITATEQTIHMSFWTAVIGCGIGTVLGVILVVARKGGILENPSIYQFFDKFINIFRSIPFIILLTLFSGFTRFIVGTTIGPTAAIVPLVIGTIPFFGRQIENALLEVDPGVIEAAQSMGISNLGIIFRVYLVEGLAGIIRVMALTLISIIGFTAMAGAIGGGGLGNLAIARGHARFQDDVIWVSTAIILVLVFVSQFVCNVIIKKITHD